MFPRMYSPESNHKPSYEYWGKVKGRKYTVGSASGKETVVCPTFGENLRFFFRYQTGFMYLRYFMWNFAGRQNDIQGNGNNIHGNWISGIKFLDEMRLGDQDNLPEDLKTNPGRNTYFLLPLLIGILGILWQYRKDRNGFFLVFAFFFMTGVAIIFYLNQYPNQPRERDYAYAGSFYAFTIWIGIGFMYVYDLLRRIFGHKLSAAVTLVILLTACPMIMAVQNWDDHDRSDRYTARDIGANYLESCAPNSILFTYGDNDSFPVWYVQDVEQVRSDIRVANLSYIQAGWYIDMMRQKAFKSDPLPFSLGSEKYVEGTRTQMPVNKTSTKLANIKEAVKFLGLDDRKFHIDISGRGDYVNYLPTNKLQIEVDTSVVLANGTVKKYFKDRLVSPMIWEYSESDALKGDLAIMDLIASNNWKRPVYISTTVPSSQYKGLEKYFIQEGMTYRIAPVRISENEPGEYGMIDPYVMYDNMMNKFKWGNAGDPSVYLDENNRRMFSNFRRLFGSLGKSLLQIGDTAKAVEAVTRGLEIVPSSKLPHDYFSIEPAEVLVKAGKKEEGEKIFNSIIEYANDHLEYIISVKSTDRFDLDTEIAINMQSLLDVYYMSDDLKLPALKATVEPIINNYYGKLYPQNR
jgi:tetratricopeptide (TPR) repeat protein